MTPWQGCMLVTIDKLPWLSLLARKLPFWQNHGSLAEKSLYTKRRLASNVKS